MEGYQLHEQAPSESKKGRWSDAAPLPWPRMAEDGVTPLGVDLTAKHLDVRRLVIRHCLAAALDTDDLVQEVTVAIWRKNRSDSAWDPRRASFGKYVILVGKSIRSHMLKAPRWRAESSGEEAPGDADEHDPLQAFELAVDAARAERIDLAETRAAGELVTRPRAPWELALIQRARQKRMADGQRRWRAARTPSAVGAVRLEALAEASPVVLPAVIAGPAAVAPRYRNEGQRLLRVAVEIHGRAEVAHSAGVVVGSIAQWLGGLFKPGPAARPLLLAAYAIPVEVWELDPLLAHNTAPPPALSHVELVAQLRASLLAYERVAVKVSPPAPIRRSRLRGAVSFYFNDLAAAAVGPLAGYDPFAARASRCVAGYC